MKLKLIWEPEILFDKFNKFIKNFKIILKRNLNQIFLTNYTVINQKNGWTSESLKNGWLTYKEFSAHRKSTSSRFTSFSKLLAYFPPDINGTSNWVLETSTLESKVKLFWIANLSFKIYTICNQNPTNPNTHTF